VLVIALAGLGKVVVKALGGEAVVYPTGTKFVAAEFRSLSLRNAYDNVNVYRIPRGTTVEYPNGAKIVAANEFDLITRPTDRAYPVELEVPGAKRGSVLEVGPNIEAKYNVSGSAWGTFTIFLTIPIALFVGIYMTRIRKGKVLEASIIGGLLTLGAVWLGGIDNDGPITIIRDYFNLSEGNIALAMAIYGFVAAVLPVSVLLCPRDYLSAFLKIGTVAMLVIGVILARPILHAPPINEVFITGGPTVPGNIFPFLFIVIMCGAVSGFHALVSSGTTPKMISNEKDARTIGYGAMLIEGLVGIVALIAAASLPAAQYYHMNTAAEDLPKYQQQIVALEAASPGKPLAEVEAAVKENLTGRTGGAVTLAVGMAKIFDDAAKSLISSKEMLKKFEELIPYWYHFAIMFEALFILTTIDTGTRVGRFLLQETMGKWIHPKLGQTAWWPSAFLATALVVGGWYYFIRSESFNAIWPMFGVSNQLLAVIALCIATVALIRGGKRKYAWVTLAPMIFITLTTLSAAIVMEIGFYNKFMRATRPGEWINPCVAGVLIFGIVICTAIIMIAAIFHHRRPVTTDLDVLEKQAV